MNTLCAAHVSTVVLLDSHAFYHATLCLISDSSNEDFFCVIEICGCGKCQAFRRAANTAAQLEVYRSVHWCAHGTDEALCTHGDCAGYYHDEVFTDEDYDTDEDADAIGVLSGSAVCSCVFCSLSSIKMDVPVPSTDVHPSGPQQSLLAGYRLCIL